MISHFISHSESEMSIVFLAATGLERTVDFDDLSFTQVTSFDKLSTPFTGTF